MFINQGRKPAYLHRSDAQRSFWKNLHFCNNVYSQNYGLKFPVIIFKIILNFQEKPTHFRRMSHLIWVFDIDAAYAILDYDQFYLKSVD